uniref:Putative secreted protein n=1 Tax=Ixodes ricinus TaxID=34613 RepID=A0A6B0UVS9_IXORI
MFHAFSIMVALSFVKGLDTRQVTLGWGVLSIQLDDDGLDVGTCGTASSERCFDVNNVPDSINPVVSGDLANFFVDKCPHIDNLERRVSSSNAVLDLRPYQFNGVELAVIRWKPDHNAASRLGSSVHTILQVLWLHQGHNVKQLLLQHLGVP